jgi:DNA repair protein RadC
MLEVIGTMDRSGPRERLRRVGVEALSDEELLALVLGTGTTADPVSVVAARLLQHAGGVAGLRRLGSGSLSKIPGIGESKAARIVAAIELGRRVGEKAWSGARPRIESSRDVDALMRPRLGSAEVERFVTLALDTKNRVMAEIEVAVGGLSVCPVSPSDVFRALVREAASSAIFVHNHPSGDARPSPDDAALTERLVRCGALLGIRVLDHVIVAREGYFSFLDAGFLDRVAPDRYGFPTSTETSEKK